MSNPDESIDEYLARQAAANTPPLGPPFTVRERDVPARPGYVSRPAATPAIRRPDGTIDVQASYQAAIAAQNRATPAIRGGDGQIDPRASYMATVQAGQVYVPPRAARTEPEIIPAKYYQGDEYSLYAQMPKEQRARVKQIMRDYRLLPEGGGGRGAEWDSTAFSAFREVMALSNANGVSWRVQISSLREQAAAAPPDEGATLPARVIQLSSPDDIKAVIGGVAQQMLGRRLDDGALNAYVQTFQALEAQEQNARYDATYAPGETGVGPGGTITDAPSAEAFAQTQLQKDYGTEVDGTKLANTLGMFLDVIGG